MDKNTTDLTAPVPEKKKRRKKSRVTGRLFSLCFFLFFRVSSWLCSIPMWLTLILHFTVGLSIWWFWGTLAAWLLAGLIRYAFIRFAVKSGDEPERFRENKNPYSNKS